MAGDGIALWFDTSVAYPAAQLRQLSQVLGMPSSSTRARAGIRPGGGLEVSVGGSPESVTVQPGCGIITDPAHGAGSYLFVIPTAITKTLTTRPATGQSRLDEVVVKILNADEVPGDGAGVREVDIEVLPGGAASGTPTAPTVAPGKLRLNELVVPAAPGAVSVQKRGPRTTALGGTLNVTDQAERDAIEDIYDGLIVYREDTDVFEGRAAGGWKKFVADNGHRPADVREGLTTGVGLNGSGQATVAHGGSTAPSYVTADVEGTTTYKAFANNPTSSGFQVTVKDMAAGTALASTTVAIKWRAVWL